MKKIIDFILIFIVFWIGNEYFSQSISIKDIQTLIIATLFMFLIGWLYCLLFIISTVSIGCLIGCLTTPILYLGLFILTPIKLWLLTKYLPGFEVHGFWTYVLLTVTFSIFSSVTQSSKPVKK